MQVILDQEQWEAGSDRTLGEVLAEVSERAHRKSRIVTSLVVDQRRITDRDLDAAFLAEGVSGFGTLTARSQSQAEIVQSAETTISRYAGEIRQEGGGLAGGFRAGTGSFPSLDRWLGKLADYMEVAQAAPDRAGGGLATSVQALLKARTVGDQVLIADVLEYEILPQLAA